VKRRAHVAGVAIAVAVIGLILTPGDRFPFALGVVVGAGALFFDGMVAEVEARGARRRLGGPAA
jgi:hypothetical protein